MSAEFDFLQGFDPTGAGSVSDAQLLQMIAQASGRTNRGFIIYQDATPDLINNTRYAGYLWIRPADNPKIVRYWDTVSSSWQTVPVSANSVVNASIQDAIIQIGKLAPTGGTAGQLVRVNGAATGLEFWTFALTNGGVALAALNTTGQGAWKVLQWDAAGTALAWRTLDISTAIADNSVAPVKITLPGAFGIIPFFLLNDTNPDGISSTNKWRQISGADLGLYSIDPLFLFKVPSGQNGNSVKVNAAGTAWGYYKPYNFVPVIAANAENVILTKDNTNSSVNTWVSLTIPNTLIDPSSIAVVVRVTIQYMDPTAASVQQHQLCFSLRSDSATSVNNYHRPCLVSDVDAKYKAGEFEVFVPLKNTAGVLSVDYNFQHLNFPAVTNAAIGAQTYVVTLTVIGYVVN